jgi:hypothetical protein
MFCTLWLVPHPIVSLTNFWIHGMYYVCIPQTEDFMSILQDLIPEVIPSQKCQWTWVRFSTVTQLRMFQIQDVLSACLGTTHFSRHVTLPEWAVPDRWIGRGGPHNWPLLSPDLTPLDSHEKHSVWAQSIQKRGTTPSNFRCCNTHHCHHHQ